MTDVACNQNSGIHMRNPWGQCHHHPHSQMLPKQIKRCFRLANNFSYWCKIRNHCGYTFMLSTLLGSFRFTGCSFDPYLIENMKLLYNCFFIGRSSNQHIRHKCKPLTTTQVYFLTLHDMVFYYRFR